MKRILPPALISLLLLLNACGTPVPSAVPPDMGTAVALTQTAAMWTPTVTPTFDPNEAGIVQWLNNELSSNTDELEKAIDADYEVMDVSFPFGPSANRIFSVTMRCECHFSAKCCVPERMFVLAMLAMKNRRDDIIGQVPREVTELRVVCLNHQSQVGIIGAGWADVKSYLQDGIKGFQLGSRVYWISGP